MASQWAHGPGDGLDPWRDEAQPQSEQRAPGRAARQGAALAQEGEPPKPEAHISRAQVRRASRANGSHGAAGGQPAQVRAAVLAVALPVVGAAVDELVGSRLGWAFAVASVLGAAVAAVACPRAGRLWVMAAPPLVVAAVTVVVGGVTWTSSPKGGKGLYAIVVRWAVDGFPAMAAAEATVLAVLAVRMIRSNHGGGNHDA